MAERKRRHRWNPVHRLDGTIKEDERKCACGLLRRPAYFKDWYFRRPDGSAFSLYASEVDEALGPCPGPSQKEKNQ